jgi:hypothetical protein
MNAVQIICIVAFLIIILMSVDAIRTQFECDYDDACKQVQCYDKTLIILGTPSDIKIRCLQQQISGGCNG